jgi:hypothetical protein
MAMPNHHDVGGQPAGPIDRHEHCFNSFERHIDALCLMMCSPPVKKVAVEELRRAKEDMFDGEFARANYYQRWAIGLRAVLVEKGVLDAAEIDARIAALRKAGA